MGENLVDQLSLSGTAKALNLVEQCLARLRTAKKVEEREKARLAHIPEDPFSSSGGGPLAEPMKVAAKPPTPRNISAWMQRISEDYPRRAAQEEWQGIVSVQLNISVDGRVAKCTVTGSSGYTVLDEAACLGFERYGRFYPANDEYGKPVEGSYSTKLTYGLN
jgi:TonB family protein